MKDVITISAKRPPFPGMDYEFLRKKGLKLIEKLAGKIWTDYNTHDPGITLLELLCYAITDLGYRTDFDIKDIIANDPESKDTPSKSFYPAREIFPCNPVTKNDYRKLLIDIEGVKNAWVQELHTSEIPFYKDDQLKSLSYIKKGASVELNGLYEVSVEFSKDKDLGDLNDNSLKRRVTFKGENDTERIKSLEIDIDINFPYWDSLNVNWNQPANILQNLMSIGFKISKKPEDVTVKVIVGPTFEFEVIVLDDNSLGTLRITNLENYIKNELETTISGAQNDSLVSLYQKKIKRINKIAESVKDTLHKHRNLCEDFISFKSLKAEEIAVCSSIEIRPEAASEKILAEIYYQIEKFIAPDIKFYTLEELLEKGRTPDQIFEGPLLNNGFIDDEELIKTQRRKEIHISDIINIIMGIDGVVAVKDIQLANFPDVNDTSLAVKSAKWCLKLSFDQFYTGRFSRELSKITFYKKKLPYFADLNKVEDILLKKYEADYPLKINDNTAKNDISIPKGEYKNISDYYSLRHHLPFTYGIGKFGLPDTASDERKAQAMQLRGFLLFFEQLLANYFAQLAHVKDLFSMNSNVDRTYFTMPFADINDLIRAGVDYPQALKDFTESEDLFTDRRNRFLDHLMARFSEQFTDYALLMYTLVGNKSQKEIIADKLDFLNTYPEISHNRGKAFNYLDKKNIWNTENVSGWEKRLCRLAGIHDYSRRNLVYTDADELFEVYQDTKKEWRFRIKSKQGHILMASEAYTQRHNCLEGFASCKVNGINKKNYNVLTSKNKKFYYTLVAQNHEIIGTSPLYTTAEERDTALNTLILLFKLKGENEGFHIVEHILLRPKHTNDKFLSIDLDKSCDCKLDADPYSFRISVILPGWLERFKDANFRNFFEQTLRTEVPAHIMLKICWISQQSMAVFENAWHSWLAENAKGTVPSHLWSEKLRVLIETMETLNNIYPSVTLYDCKEITGQNPVTLDNTVLGQINSQDNEQ
jgi:uncharacterized protein YegP (UPF0339 family)